jgi:hypothetical protein
MVVVSLVRLKGLGQSGLKIYLHMQICLDNTKFHEKIGSSDKSVVFNAK